MEIIIIILLIVITIGLGATLFVLQSKISELKNQSSVELIKTDVVELGRTIAKLNESVSDKLERSNAQVQTSVQKQLSESAKLVADVTQRLAKLDETNKRVVDVATDLKTLQNVLQNPKQRGVFGEFYLESVLDNVLPAKQYQMQYRFKDGEIVDAVIFLDKGQILPVDSKFSLENYNRMINSLKFGLFKRCLLSKATKEGVSVQVVNPYNTSKIARASYTDRMKLNVHDAASYVIARRFYQYD